MKKSNQWDRIRARQKWVDDYHKELYERRIKTIKRSMRLYEEFVKNVKKNCQDV